MLSARFAYGCQKPLPRFLPASGNLAKGLRPWTPMRALRALVVRFAHSTLRVEKERRIKMSRPKKEDPKTKRITIRVTKTEYALFTEEAQKQNMTLAEYIRHRVIHHKTEIHYDIDKSMKTQKALLREHHKIGINLNQIAHHLNSGGAETEEIRKEIRKAISDLWSNPNVIPSEVTSPPLSFQAK